MKPILQIYLPKKIDIEEIRETIAAEIKQVVQIKDKQRRKQVFKSLQLFQGFCHLGGPEYWENGFGVLIQEDNIIFVPYKGDKFFYWFDEELINPFIQKEGDKKRKDTSSPKGSHPEWNGCYCGHEEIHVCYCNNDNECSNYKDCKCPCHEEKMLNESAWECENE